jgi:hypothetical protein
MAAVDESPSRFDAARSDLLDLVARQTGFDLITVIRAGRDARTIADSRTPDFAVDLETVSVLAPGDAGFNLEAALALAAASAHPGTPAVVHVFTDAAGGPPAVSQFGLSVEWHLYGESGDNQAVVDLDAVRLSESKFQVFARFANFSETPVTREAVLSGGGTIFATQEVALEPGTSTTYSWELIGAPSALEMTLSGEDDLPADDWAFTGLPPAGGSAGIGGAGISAALVADVPGPLLRALDVLPWVTVQVISPDDYLPGSPFDLVAFRGYLPERWPGGFVLVVDPPAESDLLGVTEAVPMPAPPFPQADPLTADMDLAGVRWDRVYVPERTPPDMEALLSAGRTPLLMTGRTGLTELVLLLAETADENGTPGGFARHPAFPVLVANIAAQAAGASLPPQIGAGERLPLPPPERYPEIRIVGPDGAETVLGADRPLHLDGLGAPGIYRIAATDLEGRQSIFSLGVSAGDLAESDIAPGAWTAAIVTPPVPAAQVDQPVPLAPWLLGIAAVLFLVEAWPAWR